MPAIDPWEQELGRAQVHALAEARLLSSERLEEALADLGWRPAPSEWRAFAAAHALSLGALLFAAGFGFFVAANWSELSFFARLAVVGGALSLSTLLSGLLGSSVAGRAAGLLGGLLFGPILAIFGQTFQTGADPWQLFLTWTLVLLAYGAVAQTWELGLSALLLLHVSAFAFMTQELGTEPYSDQGTLSLIGLAALDLGLACLCAHFLKGSLRLIERLCTLSSLGLLLPYALLSALGEAAGTQVWGALAFFLVLAGMMWTSTQKRPDFVLLAAGFGALLLCSSTLLGHLLVHDFEFFRLFVLGVAISAKVGLVSRWLNRYRLSRDWELRP